MIFAIGVTSGLSFGVDTVRSAGVSLASVAGAVWGFGTLLFIFLCPVPIFGGPAEDRLGDERAMFPRNRISAKTLIYFFVFFFGSGLLALVGVLTNT